MKTKLMLTFGIYAFCLAGARAQQSKNELVLCFDRQVKPLLSSPISLAYEEKLSQLEHNAVPWQATEYTGRGSLGYGNDFFYKQDTLRIRDKVFYSLTNFNALGYQFRDYGDKQNSVVTYRMKEEFPVTAARYAPVLLLQHLAKAAKINEAAGNKFYAVYTGEIGRYRVSLFIGKVKHTLDSIQVRYYDGLYGDLTDVYHYSDYRQFGTLSYPARVTISKNNKRLQDTVFLTRKEKIPVAPQELYSPEGYKLTEEQAVKTEVNVTRYSDHIYFAELKHTDDRSMIVVFKDFVLVAEAPLNSENGDLIINEARKIAPGLPIRYFVFGHHHPHYIGGIRSFVHAGASILTVPENLSYVQSLITAQHSLNPDKLQLEAKPLKTLLIKDSLRIADSSFALNIYHIGKQSMHTDDYLIYYFPSEKMLFQDDLVWIPTDGAQRKASPRQRGLYSAIKNLGLDIEVIVQSWPVNNEGVMTIIPFKVLEDRSK
ncbi:hypothetical protein [Chitinophaga polysaccharea]|uniref:hypothetical protein n=1 Tax=Chitinophaga polysaccharea TaxID=1293035 RepID=UPI00115964CA|nr:hypothetical protein [Chitinophaga polysaccharea]